MKRVEVVAAVLIHNGLVFACQRGYGEFKDGWEFPAVRWSRGRVLRMRFAVRFVRNLRWMSMLVILSILSSMIIRPSIFP